MSARCSMLEKICMVELLPETAVERLPYRWNCTLSDRACHENVASARKAARGRNVD